MLTYALLMLLIVMPKTSGFDQMLHLAVQVPLPKDDNSCIKHAIDMAIEDVNSLPNFISGPNKTYGLKAYYIFLDKKDISSVEGLHQLLFTGPTKISAIGAPYYDQNDYATPYALGLYLTKISYIEEESKNDLPFFFQSTPSMISTFKALRSTLLYFDWTRIAIIYDIGIKKYRQQPTKLRLVLEEKDENNKSINILSTEAIQGITHHSVSVQMETLQVAGARIIIALMSVNGARKVFCEAFKRKMMKPKVTWILFEKLPADWAKDFYNYNVLNDNTIHDINCTEKQLLQAADGYISVTIQEIRRDNKTTVGNQTKYTFSRRLKEKTGSNSCTKNAAYAYDSIWVLAYLYQLAAYKVDLSSYHYYHLVFTYNLSLSISSVSFEGITGPVSYQIHTGLTEKISRFGQISLRSHPSYKDDVFIGTHDTHTKILSIVDGAIYKVFPNGNIPKDIANETIFYAVYEKYLIISIFSFTSVGMLMAFVLFIVKVTAKKYFDSVDGYGSTNIYGLVLLGSIVCYSSIIVHGIDTRFVSKETLPDICLIFVILLSTGFTLIFGSLFAKVWQLYKSYAAPAIVISVANAQKVKVS